MAFHAENTFMTNGNGRRAFTHEAWLYEGQEEFVRRIAAFIEEGIELGEPVMVAVQAQKIARLRTALGQAAEAECVSFVDMARVGRNPALIIPAWRDFVSAHESAPGVRGVGEPLYAERNPAERVECHAHEALVNVALADAPIQLLCPYDMEQLTSADIDGALANHPFVEMNGLRRANDRVATVEWLATSLPEPAGRTVGFGFDITSLHRVRQICEEETRALGFDDSRRREIALVGSEIATNSLRHGGGRGTFRCWSEGTTFLCEIRDSGWIREPMIGRVRPVPGQEGGHGVWLANHLTDLLQVRSGEAGTVVRMHFSCGARVP